MINPSIADMLAREQISHIREQHSIAQPSTQSEQQMVRSSAVKNLFHRFLDRRILPRLPDFLGIPFPHRLVKGK